jgi:hypothetical protein
VPDAKGEALYAIAVFKLYRSKSGFVAKSEARNPKSETNPKSEQPIWKTIPRLAVLTFLANLFRVSDFGFGCFGACE